MTCPRCHADNPPGVQFCGACGVPLDGPCPSCGVLNPPTNRFCHQCGQGLATATPPGATNQPARTVDRRGLRQASLPPAQAERRQLTVMFCDLVGSTALAERLDPEDMREVVRAYQEACVQVIHRFDGHVAQYLGDGLLVYFGYPVAHEDDAPRAIRAALGVVGAMEPLNARLSAERAIRLAVRLGIHTGLVVVGQMGGAGRHEQLALGETPNLAARLQALAEPDTVVISEATYRLLHGIFVCHDLGRQPLKGASVPVHAYRVLGDSTKTRLEVASAAGLTPLVGREQEVALILDRWEQVKEGHGQVVVLSGEPGIGKSRLVQVVKQRVAHEPHGRWECRCSPHHQDSALYPVIDLVQRALEFGRDESAAERRRKIAAALDRYGLADADAVALWASLLSVPMLDDHPPLNLTPQRQKQKTLDAILALLLALAAREPLLFIVEDMHWVDPSTLELLGRVVDQVAAASILMLLTGRPDFRPPWGPRAHVAQLTINRFTRRQTEVMVERLVGGKSLPAEVVRQVVTKTDGVPLFVEELTKMVVECGLLRERDDCYELTSPLPPLAIPATLQDSLMARLDRLASVKDVAQVGAALGRSFPYELLQAVASLDEPTLTRSLGALVEAEFLHQRGVPPQATYLFKHALVQDAAYQSMLISRRQALHQRIVHALRDHFAETVATQPELVAHHCTQAGLAGEAVEYWRQAGERAIERSANVEAIAHLRRGLELLQGLPEMPERAERELGLQTALGLAQVIAKGWAAPETERTHTRARELCRHVEASPQLFRALQGLAGVHGHRGEIRTGLELLEQAFGVAERLHDPILVARAHFSVGDLLLFLPELVSSRAHLEQALALYDPTRDRARALLGDPCVPSLTFLSRVLWHLGYPDQARQCSDRALAVTEDIAQPFKRAWALSWAAALHQLYGEVDRVRQLADADVALATEQVMPFFGAHGMVLRGWALVRQGHWAKGLAQLRDGVAAYQATGTVLERSHWLGLLAEACGEVGQAEEGLRVVTGALDEIERNSVRYYEAELHRLRGELLLAAGSGRERDAETCFREAIAVASRQQAKSLELRATTSLSRLLRRHGKDDDARRLLGEIYGWFTEGFESVDLREASRLLTELTVSP